MESYVINRQPKFQIKVLGFDISTEGVVGIAAACFLVLLIVLAAWF